MNTETTTTTATPAYDSRPREAKMTAMEFMESLVYGYVSDTALRARYGYAMEFTDRGVARFGAIAGWIVGLKHAGQEEFAERAADDIDGSMQRLASYTEQRDHAIAEDRFLRGRSKVTISDDGTFGGFSFCVWRAIPREHAKEEGTRINEELKQLCCVYDTDGKEVRMFDGYMRQEWMDYAFAFNGGVIYHGPGRGETFTVDFGSSRMWGIHT